MQRVVLPAFSIGIEPRIASWPAWVRPCHCARDDGRSSGGLFGRQTNPAQRNAVARVGHLPKGPGFDTREPWNGEPPRRSSPSAPFESVVSENGPREGTRDLPRPGPDAGRRAVDSDSEAGAAYRSLSRSIRRRRAELVALMEAGGTATSAARSYRSTHPLEPEVTPDEVETAVAEARAKVPHPSERRVAEERSPGRASEARH